MSEEMKKQKARENARRYYQKNKEKVLAKQKEYVKKKYATDEEFRKKTYERSRKYVKNNIEKVRESKRKWANKHYKELREKGLLPPSKQEIINDLQQKVEQLEKENFNIREHIHVMKTAIPQELTEDKTFMELYDIPSYKDLKNKVEQLENIRKEAKDFIKNKIEYYNGKRLEDTKYEYIHIDVIDDLLNILNKGSNHLSK